MPSIQQSKMLPYRSIFVLYISFSIIFSTVVKSADECTSSKVASTIIVGKTGKGKFKTVQSAIDSVPESNNKWIRILIKPGIYREKVTINKTKPCILLQGSKNQTSVIEWNDHSSFVTSDTSTIIDAGTFTSYANNIVVKNMVFKNTYNHKLGNPNDRKPAPAASIFGDKCAFYSCSFYGLQDTLDDGLYRHYFRSCLIEGAVDFIFGFGQSIYEDCNISVIANEISHQQSSDSIVGFITAQGRTSSKDGSGFVFKGGKIYGTGQAYLGRAYRRYSRVIFDRTEFSDVVHPLGWDSWNYEKDTRDITYVEANCHGSGSNKSERVRWEKSLTDSQLSKFTSLSFIDKEGWIKKQP